MLSDLIFSFKFVLLFALFVFALRKLRNYLKWRESADNIPGPPASLLTGNMLDIGRAGGLASYLRHLHQTYGPIVRYWATPTELHITINDANILEQIDIFTTERPICLVEFLRGLLGNKGLLYLTAQSAKERRTIWHKTLAKRPFDKVLPKFCEIIDKRGTEWLMRRNGEKSITVDIQSEANSLWNKLNEYNVFGNSSTSEGVQKKFQEITQVLLQIRFRFFPVLPYSELWQKRQTLIENVRKEVGQLIQEQLQHRGGVKSTGSDLFSLVLDAEELDDESSFDEILTLLFTVTDNFMGLVNIMHQIAEYKDIQERIRKEVQATWGDKMPATTDDLACLNYVRAVIKESLRYGGTSNMTLRQIKHDYFIQNKYLIPKDALVVTPISVLHRNTDYWNDPDKFDPERFIDADENRPRMAYIPFGFGTRSCLGQKYAINALTLIVGLLVRRFDINTEIKYADIAWRESIFSLHAVNGVPLILTPRSVE